MFIHNNVITPLQLNSVDSPNGRFYTTPKGDKYPSITTILGAKEKPWLNDWRQSLGPIKADKETKRCADRGTAVHSMIEKFLNNDPHPTNTFAPEHINEFNSVKLNLRKRLNNIQAQEIALFSDALKTAGRVDCIAEWDSALSVIDFKTSTNNKQSSTITDYYLQTTCYALMYQEMYDIQIDNIIIIMTVEKGMVPLIFKQQVDDYIEPLIERINSYYLMKK